MSTRPGLLDTSVLVARESGRRPNTDSLPEQTAVSVVTIGELHAGILQLPTPPPGIAAVAKANDMDVVTPDDGFDAIEEAGGPSVIRV